MGSKSFKTDPFKDMDNFVTVLSDSVKKDVETFNNFLTGLGPTIQTLIPQIPMMQQLGEGIMSLVGPLMFLSFVGCEILN